MSDHRYEWVSDYYNGEIEDLLVSFREDPDRQTHMEKLANAFFDYLERDAAEYGGWGINSKRPFGNSWVEPDIAEIIEIEIVDEEDDARVWKNQEAYLSSLYDDLGVFLRWKWLEMRKMEKSHS